MIIRVVDPAAAVEIGMEHVLFTIAVIGFLLGLIKGLNSWRKARDEAIAARALHEDMLKKMMTRLGPNGGSSVIDKIDVIGVNVDSVGMNLTRHIEKSEEWLEDNANEHREIHRRIDGMLEILVGRSQSELRRTAEKHSQRSTAGSDTTSGSADGVD